MRISFSASCGKEKDWTSRTSRSAHSGTTGWPGATGTLARKTATKIVDRHRIIVDLANLCSLPGECGAVAKEYKAGDATASQCRRPLAAGDPSRGVRTPGGSPYPETP